MPSTCSTTGQVLASPVPLICWYVSDAMSVRVKGPADADCTPTASTAAAMPATWPAVTESFAAMLTSADRCIGATRPGAGVTSEGVTSERAEASMATGERIWEASNYANFFFFTHSYFRRKLLHKK